VFLLLLKELLAQYHEHTKAYYRRVKKDDNFDADHKTNIAARLQIEKAYRNAMQQQDQKIQLSLKLYDLITRHIEKLDDEMNKFGINLNESNTKSSEVLPGQHGSQPFTSSRGAPSPRKRASNAGAVAADMEIDPNEPTWCFCNQVSYGEMVACDNQHCEKEWFHYNCVGLVEPPVGKWYCKDCKANMEEIKE